MHTAVKYFKDFKVLIMQISCSTFMVQLEGPQTSHNFNNNRHRYLFCQRMNHKTPKLNLHTINYCSSRLTFRKKILISSAQANTSIFELFNSPLFQEIWLVGSFLLCLHEWVGSHWRHIITTPDSNSHDIAMLLDSVILLLICCLMFSINWNTSMKEKINISFCYWKRKELENFIRNIVWYTGYSVCKIISYLYNQMKN